MFELAARLIAIFYAWTHNYAVAIGLVAVVVMLLITPLTLKSTKGMLEMQRLQPEMRRLQAEFKGDRQKMNEAMMKMYQEHKVNPLASCLPIAAQMPVFIIMFQALNGLIKRESGGTAFAPKFLFQASGKTSNFWGKEFDWEKSKIPCESGGSNSDLCSGLIGLDWMRSLGFLPSISLLKPILLKFYLKCDQGHGWVSRKARDGSSITKTTGGQTY